jgi:rhamnosyltransferase
MISADLPFACLTTLALNISPRPEPTTSTCAGLVLYRPDWARVQNLLFRIRGQVAQLLVFANSDITGHLNELVASAFPTPVIVLGDGSNQGLGRAYNLMLARAQELQSQYLLLFDQDSTPFNGLCFDLVTGFQGLHDRGQRPAVIGPRPNLAGSGLGKMPFRHGGGEAGPGQPVPIDFVISSGSLISLEAAQEIGPFREDFFIDAIDIEWCLRAWHKGWSVWALPELIMDHQLGRGIIALPFGLKLVDQPPHRLYTHFRNRLALIREPHVAVPSKLRMFARLLGQSVVYLVHQRFSLEIRCAIKWGIRDGLQNKLGPPHLTWEKISPADQPP